METRLQNSSITELIQDSCVICSNKCFHQKVSVPSSSQQQQQVSSVELLTLLDSVVVDPKDDDDDEEEDGTKTVATCNNCLRNLSRLQGIYDCLNELQNRFKQLQEEIASKILSCRNDDTVSHYSRAAQDVKDCVYKRWGPVLSPLNDLADENSSSSITNLESLIGSSRIPKGLVISPASPSASDVYHHESTTANNEDTNNEVHDAGNEDDDKVTEHKIQFHLDLNDFEDSNIEIGGLGTKIFDYVELEDTDEEQEGEMDDMYEEEVNAEDLIPSIEITSFSSDYLPENGDSWNNNNDDSNFVIEDDTSTEAFLPTTPPTASTLYNDNSNADVKDESSNLISLPRIKYTLLPPSSTQNLFVPSNSNAFGSKPLPTATKRLHAESALPVGLPALSPSFQRPPRKDKQSKPAAKKVAKKDPKPNSKPNPVFHCTVCPLTFHSREQFKEHLEFHKGEAPTCTICKKVFPRKHNLIIHLRTHTGEKPYECPVCQRMYSDRSNFNAHVRKHMTKPFGCVVCGKMFEKSEAAHGHATAVHPEHAIGKIISKVTFKKNKTS